MFEVAGGLIILTGLVLLSGLKVVREYDRLVVMRCGKIVGERGPGLQLVIPFIERSQKVDKRIVTMPIPAQDAITKDNIAIKVAAVCFFQIQDACKAIVNVEDPIEATGQFAQTSLRAIIGHYELDDILAHRDKINARLKAAVDQHAESWGIKIQSIELKDIEIPVNMQRAMARQAEAERLRRARVKGALGEVQAAQKLAQASDIIFAQEGAFHLRRLQSVLEIASDKNKKTTLVIPTPFKLLPDRGETNGEDESQAADLDSSEPSGSEA